MGIFKLLKDKQIRRSLYMVLFLFAFMIVYELLTAPPNPETVIPAATTAQMVSAENPDAVVDLTDRIDDAKAILDQNIRYWDTSMTDTWIYRITFNPGTEDEMDVIFGDTWFQLGEYTCVVKDGTSYSEILQWAEDLYNGK